MKIPILTLSIIAACSIACAEIPEDVAVHCILGEARGESAEGIKALAQALKNRGTIKGVYGCNANFKKEMVYIKAKGIDKIAIKAWRRSKPSKNIKKGIVNGAFMWENIDQFGKPYWAQHYERTVTIGSHTFYKSKEKIR